MTASVFRGYSDSDWQISVRALTEYTRRSDSKECVFHYRKLKNECNEDFSTGTLFLDRIGMLMLRTEGSDDTVFWKLRNDIEFQLPEAMVFCAFVNLTRCKLGISWVPNSPNESPLQKQYGSLKRRLMEGDKRPRSGTVEINFSSDFPPNSGVKGKSTERAMFYFCCFSDDDWVVRWDDNFKSVRNDSLMLRRKLNSDYPTSVRLLRKYARVVGVLETQCGYLLRIPENIPDSRFTPILMEVRRVCRQLKEEGFLKECTELDIALAFPENIFDGAIVKHTFDSPYVQSNPLMLLFGATRDEILHAAYCYAISLGINDICGFLEMRGSQMDALPYWIEVLDEKFLSVVKERESSREAVAPFQIYWLYTEDRW